MKIESEQIKNIKKISDFCRFFAISEEQFDYFRKNKNQLFNYCGLPKRNGGHRIVYPIKDDGYRNFLKLVAELLNNYYLYGPVPPPKSVHGFIKKRSIVTNAQCHVQKKILLNLDIKFFFESIKKDSIYNIFLKAGFNKKHSSFLSELVTVNDVLATGFPTSPVLANIVCKKMDYVFEMLCSKYEAVYTRYADDISISSNISIPKKIILVKILAEYGFSINEEKYKISYRGGNQYVTGLTVCDEIPRLSRKLKRSIRLEVYYIKKYGVIDHFIRVKNIFLVSKFTRNLMNGYSANGYLAFLYSVEPKFAKKIWVVLENNRNG